MKFKKILIIGLVLVLMFAVAACQSENSSISDKAKNSTTAIPKESQINENPAANNDLPADAKAWFDSYGDKTLGAYVFEHPDYTYIKVNAGEKPTGGFGIRVKDFNDESYEKRLTVEFTKPSPDAVLTQVISYPTLIYKVSSSNISSYKVVDTTGRTLPTRTKTTVSVVYGPKDNEKINNPVTVKGKIAVFEGAFVIRVLDANKKLLKEENVQTSGAPVWGSYEKAVKYDSPTTQDGYIEVGSYSAKDGTYIMYNRIKVKF